MSSQDNLANPAAHPSIYRVNIEVLQLPFSLCSKL